MNSEAYQFHVLITLIKYIIYIDVILKNVYGIINGSSEFNSYALNRSHY